MLSVLQLKFGSSPCITLQTALMQVLLEAALRLTQAILPCRKGKIHSCLFSGGCFMPDLSGLCCKVSLCDDADDKDEVPNTSSRHAAGRPSPTQQDVNTGAAQAVRELKAENRRRGTPTQHQQTVSDATQMEAAAAQDAESPAGEAELLQVSSNADHHRLVQSIDAVNVLGPMLLAATR